MCNITIALQSNVFERIFFSRKNAIVTKFFSIIIILLYIYTQKLNINTQISKLLQYNNIAAHNKL